LKSRCVRQSSAQNEQRENDKRSNSAPNKQNAKDRRSGNAPNKQSENDKKNNSALINQRSRPDRQQLVNTSLLAMI
jgi:hypothetical protein